jgi:type I restriction enzyme S subunit
MGGSVVRRTEDHVSQVALSEENLTVYGPGAVIVVFRSGVLRHTFPVATCNRPFTVNQDMKVLTPEDGIDNRFAFHLIDHLGPVVLQKATKVGTTVESVDTDSFMSLSVGLPPLPEQRRIADVLDTVDAAIQETDNVVEKQEQVKTGLLQDLLTRGLDADGRLRDPEREPEAFRETEIGQLPDVWKIQSVGDICVRVTKGTTPTTHGFEYVERGIPLLRVNNIDEHGRVTTEDSKFITSEAHESMDRSMLRPGDVLVSIAGTIGRTAVVRDEITPANINQAVALVRLQTDVLRPEFLRTYLASKRGQSAMMQNSVQLAQANLSLTQIKQTSVPVPPVEEQDRILEALRSHEARTTTEIDYGNKLHSLKEGLMQDLLTGQVRVPEAETRVDEVVS